MPTKRKALFGDLLISVTTFFRDGEAFEKLAKDVISELFKHENIDETIRVWISGCATGEEAYSFAILLLAKRRHGIVRAARPFKCSGPISMHVRWQRRARAAIHWP